MRWSSCTKTCFPRWLASIARVSIRSHWQFFFWIVQRLLQTKMTQKMSWNLIVTTIMACIALTHYHRLNWLLVRSRCAHAEWNGDFMQSWSYLKCDRRQNFSTNKTVSRKNKQSQRQRRRRRRRTASNLTATNWNWLCKTRSWKETSFNSWCKTKSWWSFSMARRKALDVQGFLSKVVIWLIRRKMCLLMGKIANHRQSTYQNKWSRELNAMTSLKQ